MALKGKELFVAESLKKYYIKEYTMVSYREGEDPPDIYLSFDDNEVAIEITELDTNVLNNRKTLDMGYIQFIDSLNTSHKKHLPDSVGLLINFYHNNTKISKIKKDFLKVLSTFINEHAMNIGHKVESSIRKVNFTIEVLKTNNGKSGFAGSVGQYGGKIKKSRDIEEVSRQIAESNLSLMSSATILNRIMDKNKKCEHLDKPVCLALYDNYYSKFTTFNDNSHIDFYNETMKDITDFGIFEKIFIIFENGDVLEFNNYIK